MIFIVFDRKGDWADASALFGSNWVHVDAHGDFRLGLQPPLGVPARAWINQLATMFCARSGLMFSWVTFANMARWLAAAMNPEPTERLVFPDFQLILDLATHLPKTAFAEKPAYLEALCQALHAVTLASGDLFRCFSGLDVERDLISQGLRNYLKRHNRLYQSNEQAS